MKFCRSRWRLLNRYNGSKKRLLKRVPQIQARKRGMQVVLNGKRNKAEKEKEKEKLYEKRSINPDLVSSVMLFQEVFKLKANYPKT